MIESSSYSHINLKRLSVDINYYDGTVIHSKKWDEPSVIAECFALISKENGGTHHINILRFEYIEMINCSNRIGYLLNEAHEVYVECMQLHHLLDYVMNDEETLLRCVKKYAEESGAQPDELHVAIDEHHSTLHKGFNHEYNKHWLVSETRDLGFPVSSKMNDAVLKADNSSSSHLNLNMEKALS